MKRMLRPSGDLAVEKANSADETSIGGEIGTTKLDAQSLPGIVVSAAQKVLERDIASLILRDFVRSATAITMMEVAAQYSRAAASTELLSSEISREVASDVHVRNTTEIFQDGRWKLDLDTHEALSGPEYLATPAAQAQSGKMAMTRPPACATADFIPRQ